MKIKKMSKNSFLLGFYLLVIFIGMLKTYFGDITQTSSLPINCKTIVVDAGHGGFDPGKVVVKNENEKVNEKDINLDISLKLQKYLEQAGSVVIPTRVDDSALSINKRGDLKNRRDTARGADVDMLISIHQNSFTKESVKGAQVFYFTKSEESKKLAECIQSRLIEVDSSNTRIAKNNSDYYLLKNTEIPAVIIECGFLSNNDERDKLKSDEYQKKIAWAIYLGINDYYII